MVRAHEAGAGHERSNGSQRLPPGAVPGPGDELRRADHLGHRPGGLCPAENKARINASGWMKAGPPRPPYRTAPEPYLEGAIKAGKGWAELNEKVKRGEL